MTDDDLIRRGDALNAIKPIYGWSITAAEGVWDAIAALPAQGVDALVKALEACPPTSNPTLSAEQHVERINTWWRLHARPALAAIREGRG
jgi:hypothetical protein